MARRQVQTSHAETHGGVVAPHDGRARAGSMYFARRTWLAAALLAAVLLAAVLLICPAALAQTQPATSGDDAQLQQTTQAVERSQAQAESPAPETLQTRGSIQPRDAFPAASQREPGTVLQDLPDYGKTLRRTGLYLLLIVVGLLVAARVLPRILGPMNPAGRSRLIEVVETHRLEPRKTLYLIRVGQQLFLIGATGDRLENLSGGDLDQAQLTAALQNQQSPPSQPAPDRPRRRFRELLKAKS